MVRDRQHGPVVELNRIQVTCGLCALGRGDAVSLVPAGGEERVPPGVGALQVGRSEVGSLGLEAQGKVHHIVLVLTWVRACYD